MKTKLLMILAVVAMLVLAGCGQKSDDVITIGSVMALSGDASAYGVEFQRVAELTVAEINAAGGINGKQLRIIYEDGKCNPKDAATAAQKLINVDGVKFILGGVCSGETLGMAPITEENKVIVMSPSSSSPDISDAGDFVFRTNPSDAFAGKVAAETTLDLGFKTAVTIAETTDYAQALRGVYEEVFTANGGEILGSESYGPEDTDFKTQLTKLKALNPEVLYLVPQSPTKGGLVLKQMSELGMEAQIVMDAVMLRGILEELADEFEGAIGVEPAFDENSAEAQRIIAAYEAAHGESLAYPFYDAATYDALYLLADAIGQFGDDTEAVRDYFYATQNRPGAVGSITFDENGDLIMDFVAKRVVDGGLEELE